MRMMHATAASLAVLALAGCGGAGADGEACRAYADAESEALSVAREVREAGVVGTTPELTARFDQARAEAARVAADGAARVEDDELRRLFARRVDAEQEADVVTQGQVAGASMRAILARCGEVGASVKVE